jgi:hypothetical protein
MDECEVFGFGKVELIETGKKALTKPERSQKATEFLAKTCLPWTQATVGLGEVDEENGLCRRGC